MTEATSAKKVGYMMKDGTIFAGISPHTKQPMYAAPADAPVKMDFITAAKYAKKLKIGGKKGFRVPTKKELQVLFDNRKEGALKGTFNLTSFQSGWLLLVVHTETISVRTACASATAERSTSAKERTRPSAACVETITKRAAVGVPYQDNGRSMEVL